MKKVFILVLVFIVWACSMSPAPTQEELNNMRAAEEIEILQVDTIQKDTIQKEAKISKKEELKNVKDSYDVQQKQVIQQINKLEDQQAKLDSILKKQKEGGS